MGVLDVKAFPWGCISPNNALLKQIHLLGAMYQPGAKYQMCEPMWEVLIQITTKKGKKMKDRNITVCVNTLIIVSSDNAGCEMPSKFSNPSIVHPTQCLQAVRMSVPFFPQSESLHILKI